MKIHDSKVEMPKHSGDYLVFWLVNVGRGAERMLASVCHFSVRHGAWNQFDDLDADELAQDYDFWAELPTKEEVLKKGDV